jgi:hypothetical protein
MSEALPPLGPVSEDINGHVYLDAICPLCGDQAFFVDLAERGEPDDFAFSCDSCDYYITKAEHPRVPELAAKLGFR